MYKKAALFLFLNCFGLLYSQNKYPTDYFINPLKVPLVLSGTFGELRSNHFHAGLDIKTQQREGLEVVSSADGYVSRINVAHYGYGNALYITHPNGYTTVYGHLKKFSPKIEAFVKKQQYIKESFTIRLYPESSQLKVEQGELIALSGNSGSSGGPHLHYEIRDTRANILNPMLFGIQIADHKKPTIQSAFAYPKNKNSQINQSNQSVQLVLKPLENGDFIANTIYAHGDISFGIDAYDALDKASNHNGIYDLAMQVNGTEIFKFTVNKFSFSESRFLNSYIDYKKYKKSKQRVQKCFVNHKANKLSLYQTLSNNGFLNVKDSLDYNVIITTKDFKGNTTKLTIPIKGKKDSIVIREKIKKTDYYFKAKEVNRISDSIVKVNFPKNIFYEDFYFDYRYKNGVAKLHNSTVPVHNYFRLSFDVSKYSESKIKRMYIARIVSSKTYYYVKTRRKANTLYASSKTLGPYALKSDNLKPTIKLVGFEKDQWLTDFKTLQVKIQDKGSGIKWYRGEIDGKWILMKFNPKKGILTYSFEDATLKKGNHTLKIRVTDNVKNSTTFTTTFNR